MSQDLCFNIMQTKEMFSSKELIFVTENMYIYRDKSISLVLLYKGHPLINKPSEDDIEKKNKVTSYMYRYLFSLAIWCSKNRIEYLNL